MAETIRWEVAENGAVMLVLDDPEQSANTMNTDFLVSLEGVLERVESDREAVPGIVISSAKSTFFAGGDLNELCRVSADEAASFAERVRLTKSYLRRLETLGIPVVAAIDGAALGGGLELALACHHRIAVASSKKLFGFPEVQLGLMPGAAGVVRSVRLLGVVEALSSLLLTGRRLSPAEALDLGLLDSVVDTPEELVPAALAWLDGSPVAVQPWDSAGYELPGQALDAPAAEAALESLLPAASRRELESRHFEAPTRIVAAAAAGSAVDFEAASEIEGEHFVELATGQTAKNMIQAFFFDTQEVRSRGRARGAEAFRPRKAVVLGAGMMGAAIAYVCAKAGIEVVLKDVDRAAAERGKAYSEGLVTKAVVRGREDAAVGSALLARIRPTTDPEDARGGDLLIEAVFEDPAVKAAALAEVEPLLAPGALLGTNTSTLPITRLAEAANVPESFIGLHFFSPVDKMPLLEIVKGEATSSETVERSLQLASMIGKVPIVVNDSHGFFTSRVIGTFVDEGVAMLLEGISAAAIERASAGAGYPAPVLALADELNLTLVRKIREMGRAAGAPGGEHVAQDVIDAMIDEHGRPGRSGGAGFYEYEDGRKIGLWQGLDEAFGASPDSEPGQSDLEDRLLFIEAIESLRCREEGVIESAAEANIGSILGIGYPGWTGGVEQFVDGYVPADPASAPGPAAFVSRARELAAAYGERFEPPAALVERVEGVAALVDGASGA